MATSLSNLIALLSLDDSAYHKGLSRSRKATETFSGRLSKTFTRIGGAVVGGMAIAAGATAGFLASTIEPASDLNETISKTEVVFGESAQTILDWSKISATALGMSKNSALGAAATYGNLFRAMEISEESSSKMSTGLVKLAADLASFNNMDPTMVLDKLRAGLSGETEPLKSLGININQALLQEKALEMGLWDGVGALTAAQKAQAAYALIMKQTTLAQGDFARTSDGLANQQRILKAQFENIKATVGSALLPVLTNLATTMSDYLAKPETAAVIQRITEGIASFAQQAIENLPQVIQNIQNVFGWLQENEGVFVGIFAVLGVAVTAWAVTTAAAAWTAMAPFLPVIAVIALVAAAAYLLYEAWTNNWGGIQEKTQAFVSWIKPTLDRLWKGILLVFGFFKAQFQTLFEAFSLAFQGDWRGFGDKLREGWDRAWALIKAIGSKAWEAIKNFFRNTDWGLVGRNILEGIARGITGGLRIIANAARNAASAALEAAKGFLGIRSPSQVFEMQVGYQMAAGLVSGWESGLSSLLQPSLGALQPAAVPGVSTATPNAGQAGSLEREIYRMLRQLPETLKNANREVFEKARRE